MRYFDCEPEDCPLPFDCPVGFRVTQLHLEEKLDLLPIASA